MSDSNPKIWRASGPTSKPYFHFVILGFVVVIAAIAFSPLVKSNSSAPTNTTIVRDESNELKSRRERHVEPKVAETSIAPVTKKPSEAHSIDEISNFQLSCIVTSTNRNELDKVLTDKPELLKRSVSIGTGKGSILHLAAWKSNPAMVKEIISHGLDVNIEDAENETPLHYAVEASRLENAEALIAAGADVDAQNRNGTPPLYKAVTISADLVKLLLINHAKPDLTDNDAKETALHHAAESGTPEVIELLIKAGADKDAVAKIWGTPLHCAVSFGKLDNVKKLIACGANVNKRDMTDGSTPLHEAMKKYGRTDKAIAQFLKDNGAVDKSGPDHSKR